MENTTSLPAGFESLAPFAAEWVLADAASRMAKRQNSSYEDIHRFYRAAIVVGQQALDYLKEFQLGALPPEGEQLLKLMLSLAEIGPAVEWYKDPKVYDGFEVGRIRYVKQIPDTSAQP